MHLNHCIVIKYIDIYLSWIFFYWLSNKYNIIVPINYNTRDYQYISELAVSKCYVSIYIFIVFLVIFWVVIS